MVVVKHGLMSLVESGTGSRSSEVVAATVVLIQGHGHPNGLVECSRALISMQQVSVAALTCPCKCCMPVVNWGNEVQGLSFVG